MGAGYSDIPVDTIGMNEICATAITGDLLLFEGKALTSGIIRLGGMSGKWSHVALVLSDANGTYLYESTIGGKQADEITHRAKNGPRIIDLRTRLTQYVGESIVYRKIFYRNSDENWVRPSLRLRMDWTKKIWKFAEMTNPASTYEFNVVELIGSVFRANSRDPKNYFCVELTAESLEVAGILVPSENPNNYTLFDFSELGYLPTEPGLKYSDHVRFEI